MWSGVLTYYMAVTVMMVVPGVLFLSQFLIDLDQIKTVICTIQYVRT